MFEIRQITTVNQFEKLRDSWNQTLRRSKDDSPSLTWEHVAVSVKHLKTNQKLRILLITDPDKIVAIAPFRQSYYAFRRHFSYSVLDPLDYGAATDYNGIILTEKETTCMRLLLSHLYHQNDWDFFYINDIPERSTVIEILASKYALFPKFKLEKGAICPYLEFPDSTNDFLKDLSRNYRRNLARRKRNLQKDHGELQLKEYEEVGTLEQALKIFFDLHQKRWISKGELGAFNSKEMRNIFQDRARLFAGRDWLGLYFLTVNGKPIAAKYCLRYNKKIFGCLSGFDPAFSSYSVGRILLIEVLKKTMLQGYEEYDFMKGDEPYKFRLTRKFRRNLNLEFINSRLSSQLIAFALRMKKGVRAVKFLKE